jgi:hypothetical protein
LLFQQDAQSIQKDHMVVGQHDSDTHRFASLCRKSRLVKAKGTFERAVISSP